MGGVDMDARASARQTEGNLGQGQSSVTTKLANHPYAGRNVRGETGSSSSGGGSIQSNGPLEVYRMDVKRRPGGRA